MPTKQPRLLLLLLYLSLLATVHELEPLVVHDTVDGVATTHEK
jgi:hypothetical protein